MYLKRLISRQAVKNLSIVSARLESSEPNFIHENVIPLFSSQFHSSSSNKLASTKPSQNPQFRRQIHTPATEPRPEWNESEDSSAMNEFLSRFVWIMRKKITEAYPDFDKPTVNGMLQAIAEVVASEIEAGAGGLETTLESAAPPPEFSEDLWATVLVVTNEVLADMRRAANKEKMRKFLQCEEVKDMTRFAVEVGVRGEMLREMRFKWAREKMEESEFREGLESLREQEQVHEHEEEQEEGQDEEQSSGVSLLPKRRGIMKYKIYGLDLSALEWSDVAERARVTGETVWPEEAKPISGKCKAVNDKILGLNEEDDPTPYLAEWAELLQPNRADWNVLLDGIRQRNTQLYLKVAELILSKESYQATVHDYSNLINTNAKAYRFKDAERIFLKMQANGFSADLLTATVLLHMYCKLGDLNRAIESFQSLKSHGFQPDSNIYNAMITAYVAAGKPEEGEALLKEMDSERIEPNGEIFFALLRSFSNSGDFLGCERMIRSSALYFPGIKTGVEAQKLFFMAHVNAPGRDQKKARDSFDALAAAVVPDDECVAGMISIYEESNSLDKAVALILELEKRPGFGLGVNSYTILADWLGKMNLVDEVEQILGKISELGEAPPVRLHVCLCDMYSRVGLEKKALQAFGVLEAKKDELGQAEFVRVIKGLEAGGFMSHANRMRSLMESRGFSEPVRTKTLGLKETWLG